MDTNIISDVIQSPDGSAALHLAQIDPKQVFTSVIVAAELRYGCGKKKSSKLTARVNAFLKLIPVLPLDTPVDVEYGDIRATLEAAGQIIGANDLLIAAHARARQLTLVTDNPQEFSRVNNLKVENWKRDLP
ncbi:tRNA(fMet)-specific endonuclease VapC [Duganella sp. 1224]|nr:tRNA(fMet)-specific endonuclease VapC [Duganella sp. 1224]